MFSKPVPIERILEGHLVISVYLTFSHDPDRSDEMAQMEP